MHALIIDDEDFIRNLLQDIIEPLSWRVTMAGDCSEGLDKLSSPEEYDVVFVDWRTPKLSGLEFTKKVRSDPKFSSIPLLMITGMNEEEDISNAITAGVNEYLMKPFTYDMVFDKLRLLGFEIPENI